jgi:hypothetical protein
MKRTSLVAVTVTWLALVAIGCTPECPRDEVRVKEHGGGSVCVPRGDNQDGSMVSAAGDSVEYESPYDSIKVPATGATSRPPAVPDNGGGSSAPSSGCRNEDAGDLTVHLVAKSGAAPALGSSPVPDGRYALVQATWFAGAAGAAAAPSVDALRAELVVQGAVWTLGARAVDASSTLEPTESVTLSVVSETATHVCSIASAKIVSAFVPPAGQTTRATVEWDPTVDTLTMVITTPKGADAELVFVPE